MGSSTNLSAFLKRVGVLISNVPFGSDQTSSQRKAQRHRGGQAEDVTVCVKCGDMEILILWCDCCGLGRKINVMIDYIYSHSFGNEILNNES